MAGRKTVKVVNPDGLRTIGYAEIKELQDDFKDISEEALGKLKDSIKKYGVFLPKFVWEGEEAVWCLDGHQTKKALAGLEAEGWKIPPIPIVAVTAENRREAREKLLVINSRYGKINPAAEFLSNMRIPDFIDIPDIKLELVDPDFKPADLPPLDYRPKERARIVVIYFTDKQKRKLGQALGIEEINKVTYEYEELGI